MNKAETIAAIKAISPNLTVRVADGEWRVSVNLQWLKDTFGYGHQQAIERNESLAAYCDKDDAVATAKALHDWCMNNA